MNGPAPAHAVDATGAAGPREVDPRRRDAAFRAAGVIAVGVVLFVAARKFGSLQDDAFIYLRYADNLLHGRGLVFNPGERVEGFTSPLWLAVLAVAGSLGVPLTLAAGVFGALATAATVLLSAADARRCGPPGWFALLPPIGLATFLPLLLWSVSGLETALFTALLWGALARHRAMAQERARDLPRRTAAGLGLGFLLAGAFLARPEGALAVIAIGVSAMVRSPRGERASSGRGSLRAGAAVVAPPLVAGIALVVARGLYYHDILPNTFYAKMGGTLRHAWLGARYVAHYLGAAPLAWPAVGLLAGRAYRRVPGLAASGAFVVLYVANIVRVGGDYFQYFRFMVPLTPLLYALGAEGAHALFTAAAARWTRVARMETAAAALAGVAVIGAQSDPILAQSQHGLEWCTRWGELGRSLAAALPEGTRIAAPNVGAIGYMSKLPIEDLLGLIDRDLARRPSAIDPGTVLAPGDVGHDHFDAAWSLARRPQVVVFMHAVSSEPFTDASEIPADLLVERALLARLAQDPGYRLTNVPLLRSGDEPRQYWGVFVRGDVTRPSGRSPAVGPPQ